MSSIHSSTKVPKIGDVYMACLEGIGSVQKGRRPVVVFQNNMGNAYSPNLVVLPLTSKLKKLSMPTHVLVRAEDSGLKIDSMVLCENPQSISKSLLGQYVTTLPDSYMKQIAAGSIVASSAISFMDVDSIMNVWQKAIQLNSECKVVSA